MFLSVPSRRGEEAGAATDAGEVELLALLERLRKKKCNIVKDVHEVRGRKMEGALGSGTSSCRRNTEKTVAGWRISGERFLRPRGTKKRGIRGK